MANVLVSIEHGIEIAAVDLLRFMQAGQKAEPVVIAALGALLGATGKAVAELNAAAQNPVNIALDIQTAKDLMAVWPAIKAFAATMNIKL